MVVVVAGAGIGSVSWNCSPRTGAATPASAGPAVASSIGSVVVVDHCRVSSMSSLPTSSTPSAPCSVATADPRRWVR